MNMDVGTTVLQLMRIDVCEMDTDDSLAVLFTRTAQSVASTVSSRKLDVKLGSHWQAR